MALLGKFIGGIIGLTFGGPLGALAGVALGDYFFDNKKRFKNQNIFRNEEEKRNSIFFLATFACLGKLASVDGHISEDEIKVLEKFIREDLKMDKNSESMAKKIFFSAASSNDSYESYAKQFYDTFKSDRNMIFMLMEIQLKIVMADNLYHDREKELIEKARKIFYITNAEFDRLKALYMKSENFDYDILQCKPSDSDEAIKRSYRKLLKEYHPDVLASKGLSEEFMEMARKKFDNIQNAYDNIRKKRGF